MDARTSVTHAPDQLREELRNPDVMQRETCAITCRVAPSFLRVVLAGASGCGAVVDGCAQGHVDLFARRVRANRTDVVGAPHNALVCVTCSGLQTVRQLEQIVDMALFREFPHLDERSVRAVA